MKEHKVNDHAAGLRIKYLRKKKGLSIQQVANHIGRSVGFVSQIERGISRPGVDDINGIAGLLEVDSLNLFSVEKEPASHRFYVKSNDHSTVDYRGGIRDELLSPNISGKFYMLLTEIAPGASSGDNPMKELGEQGGLLLEGMLEFVVGDESFILEAGDSFQFASTLQHSYLNKSDVSAKILWVFSHR